MINKMTTMKPCRHCNTEPCLDGTIDDNEMQWLYVICPNCKSRGPRGQDNEDAIRFWNEMQEPSGIQEWLIDKIKNKIDGYNTNADTFSRLRSPRPHFAIDELEWVLALLKPNTECPVCHGAGSIENSSHNPNCVDQWIECPNCNGTGNEPEEIPEWLKIWLTETITNCELLADELMDKSVGNGTNGDIEEAVRLKRRANTFREVLSLKKPEE